MKKYNKILEPIQIRNFTLKNRIYSSNSMPHFLQGSEPYPNEATIVHLANRAKKGAAIVTVGQINTQYGMETDDNDQFDVAHFPDYDLYNPKAQNYLTQLADTIHLYQSLAFAAIFSAGHIYPYKNKNGDIEAVKVFQQSCQLSSNNDEDVPMIHMENEVDDSISQETLRKVSSSFAQQAKKLKALGYDGVVLHMCYRSQILGQFLSPLSNKRTDEYGGNIENRSKFPIEVLK